MDRFKVVINFYKPKFCGIRFNKNHSYDIIDTYDDNNKIIYNDRSKEYVEARCKWLNASINAPLYRVFKNGLDKYFICYKIGFHKKHGFSDGVSWYDKIEYSGNKIQPLNNVTWDPGSWDHKIHVSECNFFPKSVLTDGVDSLEEACEMLTLIIEKHNEIEEIQKQWRIKTEKESRAVPVDCINV